jgi:hypothetical protein
MIGKNSKDRCISVYSCLLDERDPELIMLSP